MRLPTFLALFLLFMPLAYADLDPAPELDPGEYLASLSEAEQIQVVQAASQLIQARTGNAEIAETVAQAFWSAAHTPSFSSNRVLHISLDNLARLQAFIDDGGLSRRRTDDAPPTSVPTLPVTAVEAWGDLVRTPFPEIVGNGRAPFLPAVHLAMGHRFIPGLGACEIAQSERLAQILTAWAADPAQDTESLALMGLFGRKGHSVEVIRNHTLADFIALADERVTPARPIRLPLWVDTGIPLEGGRTLDFPVMHSEHIWRIRGPQVNARVSFYLGTEGVGYFPKTAARPTWAGERVMARFTNVSEAQIVTIKQITRESALYLRETRLRSEQQGGLGADGYGILGICNDSTRAVARTLPGFDSNVAWPLLGDLNSGHRAEWRTRILNALPYSLDDASRWTWAEGLRADLLLLRAR